MTQVIFGEWLKRRRQAAGWTQKQLVLHIHCSINAVQKMEAEEHLPRVQILEKLAEYFGKFLGECQTFTARHRKKNWRPQILSRQSHHGLLPLKQE